MFLVCFVSGVRAASSRFVPESITKCTQAKKLLTNYVKMQHRTITADKYTFVAAQIKNLHYTKTNNAISKQDIFQRYQDLIVHLQRRFHSPLKMQELIWI